MVEIDSKVVEVSRNHLPTIGSAFDDERAGLYFEDGARFVRGSRIEIRRHPRGFHRSRRARNGVVRGGVFLQLQIRFETGRIVRRAGAFRMGSRKGAEEIVCKP